MDYPCCPPPLSATTRTSTLAFSLASFRASLPCPPGRAHTPRTITSIAMEDANPNPNPIPSRSRNPSPSPRVFQWNETIASTSWGEVDANKADADRNPNPKRNPSPRSSPKPNPRSSWGDVDVKKAATDPYPRSNPNPGSSWGEVNAKKVDEDPNPSPRSGPRSIPNPRSSWGEVDADPRSGPNPRSSWGEVESKKADANPKPSPRSNPNPRSSWGEVDTKKADVDPSPNPRVSRWNEGLARPSWGDADSEKTDADPNPSPSHRGSGRNEAVARPSRGDAHLDWSSRPKQVQKESKPVKGKEKKKPDLAWRTEPCCYGCGAPQQTAHVDAPGYVPLDVYQLKKKHHQLKTVLCGRCQLLTQGQMIPAVGGHGGYIGGRRFVSAEQLRLQLLHLRTEKALIIKLVDIVDFNGSFLSRIRDIIGGNPIILVLTKVDLLPKGTNLNAVGDWLVEYVLRKKINVTSIHLTSSKSLMGIGGVLSDIQQQRQGRDVYIVGAANVGKSAFVSALLQTLAQRNPFAGAAQKRKPVQSAMPGTTLGPIQIEAFSGRGSLFDTPGIHLHHRIVAAVPPQDLKFLAPHRRLRGFLVAPEAIDSVPEMIGLEEKHAELELDEILSLELLPTSTPNSLGKFSLTIGQSSLSGVSLFWGGVMRLDVIEAPSSVRLRFYGPSVMPIASVPTAEADIYYKEELGKSLVPPKEEGAKSWLGLPQRRKLVLPMVNRNRPIGDIAISGLGWITVETYEHENGFIDDGFDMTTTACDDEIEIVVHVPKGIEVFVRPPIPVSSYGLDWYEYAELTEKEQEEDQDDMSTTLIGTSTSLADACYMKV